MRHKQRKVWGADPVARRRVVERIVLLLVLVVVVYLALASIDFLFKWLSANL